MVATLSLESIGQLIASGKAADYDAALRSFAEYRSLTQTDDHRHLADGYAAITLLAAGRDVATARARFDAAVAGLRTLDTEDARFFADQLLGVRRHFVRP